MSEPTTHLDARYGDATAPLPWTRTQQLFATAELYWLSTVRRDGRPHVTPLIGVWHDRSFYFCTGQEEQKCRNLLDDPGVSVTTGSNTWSSGTDVVLEGSAAQVTDQYELAEVSAAYLAKYGEDWRFEVHDEGGFVGGGREGIEEDETEPLALVFRVPPEKVIAFTKDPHGQTTHDFA